MSWRENVDSVYDLVSKSLIICYFALLVSIVFLMVLYVIPTDVDVLNYGEIISSIVLIFVTIVFSYESNKLTKQTKQSQDRSLKISYIQNRLEKFYYPYLEILKIIITDTEYKSNKNSVKTLSIGNMDQHDWVISKLDELVKYQHFAFPESKKNFNSFRQVVDDYYKDDIDDYDFIAARSIIIDSVEADIKDLETKLYEDVM